MGKHHKRHSIPTLFEAGIAIRSLTPTYHMVDFMRDGKRVRKGYEDLAEAKKFCRARALEIKNDGTRTMALPQPVREDALKAMKLLEGSGVTILAAVQDYLRRHPMTVTQTVEETCDKYLAAMRVEGRRELSIYEKDLKFRALKQSLGETPIGALDDADIEVWAKAREVGKLTTEAYVGAARDLVLFYRRNNRLKPRRHDDEKPPVTWDTETVGKLMKEAEKVAPEVVPALAVLFFAGLRPHEMLRLGWDQVDLETGVIRLTGEETKTRTMRNVEIADNLRAWLEKYTGTGRVAPEENAYRIKREKVMEACALSGWPVDVARHTFATMHYNAHQNAAATMAQLGHFGNPQMFLKHYKGVPVTAAEAKAFWKILPDESLAKNRVVPFLQAAAG